MAATVKDVMNPELFSLRPTDTAESALDGILGLGISGAPVLDASGRPLGMVSLRDLVSAERQGRTAGARMTSPPVVVREDADLADAARLIAETGYRRLVVVDAAGRAVGMVSAIDVIRGFMGIPARHPAAFPHLDAELGLTWTDDVTFDQQNVDGAAPDGPGIFLLVHDAPRLPRRVVWVESAQNVHTRLTDMLSLPQQNPELAGWLAQCRHLRFRAGAVSDAERRHRIAATMRARVAPWRSRRATRAS